jgi:hypothetical protein
VNRSGTAAEPHPGVALDEAPAQALSPELEELVELLKRWMVRDVMAASGLTRQVTSGPYEGEECQGEASGRPRQVTVT